MNFAALHRLQTLVTHLLQILNRRAALVQKVHHLPSHPLLAPNFHLITSSFQRRWDAAFKIQLWARVCMAKSRVYVLRDKRKQLVQRNNAAVWMQVLS